jgi:hypothetical protein
VSRRPLVLVSALAVGDYLLWNWSLNGNHDVLALVSGLTLPPLVVIFLWLLALNFASMLAGAMQRSTKPRAARGRGRGRARRRRAPDEDEALAASAAAAAKARADARKLAA